MLDLNIIFRFNSYREFITCEGEGQLKFPFCVALLVLHDPKQLGMGIKVINKTSMTFEEVNSKVVN